MMAVLEFIFSGFWTFFGVLILLGLICQTLMAIFASFAERRKRP